MFAFPSDLRDEISTEITTVVKRDLPERRTCEYVDGWVPEASTVKLKAWEFLILIQQWSNRFNWQWNILKEKENQTLLLQIQIQWNPLESIWVWSRERDWRRDGSWERKWGHEWRSFWAFCKLRPTSRETPRPVSSWLSLGEPLVTYRGPRW